MSKKQRDNQPLEAPSLEVLEGELKRIKYMSRFRRTLLGTVSVLITVAAVAVLAATLWLPVLEITGNSMTPALYEDQIVVSVKNASMRRGDMIAFYYNNRVLVKRVIALPGEWVNIDENGNVYINDELYDEPYIEDKARGECDIELPYQVPDGRVFVMGDHRSTSIDSRSKTVGCVTEEQIVGRLILRVWPLDQFGVLQ